MKKKPQQIFHPLTMLPLISQMLSEQVQQLQGDYANFLLARPKPHVLDDSTIQRAMKMYTESRELLPCYPKQLDKWKKEEKLSEEQSHMIDQAYEHIKTIEKQLADMLMLLDELAKGTIEKVMAKSDLEMGLEFLKKSSEGKWKP